MVEVKRKGLEILKKSSAPKKEEKQTLYNEVKKRIDAWRKEMIHVKIFLKRSKKPKKAEYLHMLRAHVTGVLLLGFLGYIITFIHIPVNNILFGVKK